MSTSRIDRNISRLKSALREESEIIIKSKFKDVYCKLLKIGKKFRVTLLPTPSGSIADITIDDIIYDNTTNRLVMSELSIPSSQPILKEIIVKNNAGMFYWKVNPYGRLELIQNTDVEGFTLPAEYSNLEEVFQAWTLVNSPASESSGGKSRRRKLRKSKKRRASRKKF